MDALIDMGKFTRPSRFNDGAGAGSWLRKSGNVVLSTSMCAGDFP
jgi:hypothetical protein